MGKNIAALTLPGVSYPAYVSINYERDGISVTVRSAATDGKCGNTAQIVLTPGQWLGLLEDIRGHTARQGANGL